MLFYLAACQLQLEDRDVFSVGVYIQEHIVAGIYI